MFRLIQGGFRPFACFTQAGYRSASLFVGAGGPIAGFREGGLDTHKTYRKIYLTTYPKSKRKSICAIASTITGIIMATMAPTAITFRRGHRIRVQVSSGAHPLFARNTGSGEPLGEATRMFPSRIEVFHDPEHPSGVDLPISTI